MADEEDSRNSSLDFKMADEKDLRSEKNEETTTLSTEMLVKDCPQAPTPPRRPDLDFLRVCLTFIIIAWHVSSVYLPIRWYILDPWRDYLQRDWTDTVGDIWRVYTRWWTMHLYFFLSGFNTYLALWRRDEIAFRLERCHRLAVPVLFMLGVTNVGIVATYWEEITPACLKRLKGGGRAGCPIYFLPNSHESLGHYAVNIWTKFGMYTAQGWFLIWLFIQTQVLATFFCICHPSSASVFARLGRRLDAAKPGAVSLRLRRLRDWGAASPRRFASAVYFCVGGESGVKLVLIPGVGLSACLAFGHWLYPSIVSWFYDFPEGLGYIFVQIAGFALAAIDDRVIVIIKRKAWLFLVAGHVILIAFRGNGTFFPAFFAWMETLVDSDIVSGIWGGFGIWLTILGSVGVARKLVTSHSPRLAALAEMSMPIYITHIQILVFLGVFFLRLPLLHHFLFFFLFLCLVLLVVARLIVSSSSIKYFFGLRPEKGAWLPGERLCGLGPCLALLALTMAQSKLREMYLIG